MCPNDQIPRELLIGLCEELTPRMRYVDIAHA